MSHASMSNFYRSVVNPGTSNDFEQMLELEPFPIRTRYDVSFSFPTGSLKNPPKMSLVDVNKQLGHLNKLINLLLQDIKLPKITYSGVNAGDAKFSQEKSGGLGGQFSTLADADLSTDSEPDIEMSFISTKFSLVERYFLPWIKHCTDTKSAEKYGVYPFVRANLDVVLYNDTAGVMPTEADILYAYQFQDVYPYEISLNDLHCANLGSKSERTVRFDYNNFKLVPTFASDEKIFVTTPKGWTDAEGKAYRNQRTQAKNDNIKYKQYAVAQARQQARAAAAQAALSERQAAEAAAADRRLAAKIAADNRAAENSRNRRSRIASSVQNNSILSDIVDIAIEAINKNA